MSYELLDNINSPEDLKKLSDDKIPGLCTEIRSFLIDNVERTGGHLASNLGVTELTVALHRVFDSPRDHIIFDVGHQSYVHKILTGRKSSFDILRKTGGLSGFTSMRESEHDAFGAGHSSTSLSAALGYAEADKLKGSDAYSIAVVGDGAYTGGMIHEALNNCNPDLKLIIILNENGMSISVNKGRLASYLSRVRMSKGYLKFKKKTKSFLEFIPLLGKPLYRFSLFIRQKIKNSFFASNYFEDLDLYYIGTVDGNDYDKVEYALSEAKRLGKCSIIHIKTTKGKGYEPAERSPDTFHSVAANKPTSRDTFHSVFAGELINLASEDSKIVAITPAMGIGTGLDAFEAKFENRYFDVGIAEEHALTFAAGLAASGLKPYAAIYSTFLQRGYDSIVHDICLQNLPVRIMIDRAGLAVSDGATHHGIFDVSFLSHIPNMEIHSPASYQALLNAVRYANECKNPIAIRYPNAREKESVVKAFYSSGDTDVYPKLRATFEKGNTPRYVFITYGAYADKVLSAKEILEKNAHSVGVVLLEALKPYGRTADELLPYLENAEKVIFAEEGIKNGGAGMLIENELLSHGFDVSHGRYEISAIDDNFASPTELCELYDFVGLSPEKLAYKMLDNGNN